MVHDVVEIVLVDLEVVLVEQTQSSGRVFGAQNVSPPQILLPHLQLQRIGHVVTEDLAEVVVELLPDLVFLIELDWVGCII